MKRLSRILCLILTVGLLICSLAISVFATENSIEYFEANNYDFYVNGVYTEGVKNFVCTDAGTTLYWHTPYAYGYTVCSMIVQVRGTLTAVYMGDGSNTNYPCTITPLSGGYYEVTYTSGGFSGHLTFTFYGTGTQTMVSCKVFPRDMYYESPVAMRYAISTAPLVAPDSVDDFSFTSFYPDTLTSIGSALHRTVIIHMAGNKSADRYFFNLLTQQLDVVNYQVYDESYLPVEHWDTATSVTNDGDVTINNHIINIAWDNTGSTTYFVVLNCSNTTTTTGYIKAQYYSQYNTASEDEQFGIIWKFWNKLLGWVEEIKNSIANLDGTGGSIDADLESEVIGKGDEISSVADQIGAYEQQHQQSMESGFADMKAASNLGNYAKALRWVGGYATAVFTNLGDFQIVLTLPLVLGFIMFIASRSMGSSKPRKEDKAAQAQAERAEKYATEYHRIRSGKEID